MVNMDPSFAYARVERPGVRRVGGRGFLVCCFDKVPCLIKTTYGHILIPGLQPFIVSKSQRQEPEAASAVEEQSRDCIGSVHLVFSLYS